MDYLITDFGACGDGSTNDAPAIQKAVDTCTAAGGGRVVVPAGKVFLSGSIVLKSNVELYLESGALLKASGRAEDFNATRETAGKNLPGKKDVPSYVNCEYDGRPYFYFIYAKGAQHITISGTGCIDGNDSVWRGDASKYHIEGKCYPRIPMLLLEEAAHLTICGVTLQNCGFWTVHMAGCNDVLIDSIRILNSLEMANCDGIDPDHCKNVRIVNCHIECADDCIVLKSSKAYCGYGACENIIISGCTLISTSAAIKFGTESEQDFRNVIISNCIISRSNRGISLQLRDAGNIEDVQVSNIIIETRRFSVEWWGAAEPLVITCLDRKPGVKAGHIRNVSFRDITCNSENGILLYGSVDNHIKDIRFDNINLNLQKTSKWSVDGYDLRPCASDGKLMTKIHPVYCRFADNVCVSGLKVNVDSSMQDIVLADNYSADSSNVCIDRK